MRLHSQQRQKCHKASSTILLELCLGWLTFVHAVLVLLRCQTQDCPFHLNGQVVTELLMAFLLSKMNSPTKQINSIPLPEVLGRGFDTTRQMWAPKRMAILERPACWIGSMEQQPGQCSPAQQAVERDGGNFALQA